MLAEVGRKVGEFMNVDELKAQVEAYRKGLEDKSGHLCRFSETGPVGMSLIDAIVSVLEAQQQQIDHLEKSP